jgi:hypothetical protein
VAAEALTQSWPREAHGRPKRLDALHACVAFLEGKATAERVRRCMIAAAIEADILDNRPHMT